MHRTACFLLCFQSDDSLYLVSVAVIDEVSPESPKYSLITAFPLFGPASCTNIAAPEQIAFVIRSGTFHQTR